MSNDETTNRALRLVQLASLLAKVCVFARLRRRIVSDSLEQRPKDFMATEQRQR